MTERTMTLHSATLTALDGSLSIPVGEAVATFREPEPDPALIALYPQSFSGTFTVDKAQMQPLLFAFFASRQLKRAVRRANTWAKRKGQPGLRRERRAAWHRYLKEKIRIPASTSEGRPAE